MNEVDPPQWVNGENFFIWMAGGLFLLLVVGQILGIWLGPVVFLLAIGCWGMAYRERPRRLLAAVEGSVPKTRLITSCVTKNRIGLEACHLFVMTDMLHIWRSGAAQHHNLEQWVAAGGVPDRENHGTYRIPVRELLGIIIKKDEVLVESRSNGSAVKTTRLAVGPHGLALIRPLVDALGWKHTTGKDGVHLSATGRRPQAMASAQKAPA